MPNEDDKFESLLAQRRHKELSSGIAAIATAFSKKSNQDIIEAINNQASLINSFLQKLGSVEKPSVLPEVNVEVNQKEVVLSVDEMSEKILSGFSSLKEVIIETQCKSNEWEFSVQRDVKGFIEKVIAVKIR